jgi:hypothetical protein
MTVCIRSAEPHVVGAASHILAEGRGRADINWALSRVSRERQNGRQTLLYKTLI